jgi:hypothetical protein
MAGGERTMVVEGRLKIQLLKDVLGRANKQEKQDYEDIKNKKDKALGKLKAMLEDRDRTIERSERNKYPKETPNTVTKPVTEMSMEEFNEYIRQLDKYFTESFAWANESIEIMTEYSKLMNAIVKSIIELGKIRSEEKWLLLSIALRQPTLLNYLK